MKLSNQEIELIKLALDERAKSNEKILKSLSDAGVRIEADESCNGYLNELYEIDRLFIRFSQETN